MKTWLCHWSDTTASPLGQDFWRLLTSQSATFLGYLICQVSFCFLKRSPLFIVSWVPWALAGPKSIFVLTSKGARLACRSFAGRKVSKRLFFVHLRSCVSYWPVFSSWDTMAGTAESQVASSGLDWVEGVSWGPLGHTGWVRPPFPPAKENHLLFLCILQGSFTSLFLCVCYFLGFSPDSFSKQFLLIYYTLVDTSFGKASCVSLLDQMLVVILWDLETNIQLSWHLHSSVITGFLACLPPVLWDRSFRARITSSIVHP